MECRVCVIGAGLAGSEAALQLAARTVPVTLVEARPHSMDPVHKTSLCAELVCSNSLKSEKPDSAAGMLKEELSCLGSFLYQAAVANRVPAGGALAVERDSFACSVTTAIENNANITLVRDAVASLNAEGCVVCSSGAVLGPFDAIVIATGPLTSDGFAAWMQQTAGSAALSFYDAAAPIVYAESIDMHKVFSQSRYENGAGDYLNAAFSRQEYEHFVEELVGAQRVVAKDFESADLFQACQPIEEIARTSPDAPRFGPLKPVGLKNPATGKRPWAALQLRAEDKYGQSYNLVGCQTNLAFSEQERVFRLVPGLENVQFARYGVMHRNTFLDAPRLMDRFQRVDVFSQQCKTAVYLAGQVAGTEGYCEAIRSGLHAALSVVFLLANNDAIPVPEETAYGALLSYACSAQTKDYQPMHVNFGIVPPLASRVRNKQERYHAYAQRGSAALHSYKDALVSCGVLPC